MVASLLEPRRILVTVDGSGHGPIAARLLANLMLDHQCTVTLLIVGERYRLANQRRLLEAWARTAKILQQHGLTVDSALMWGHPQNILIRYAKETAADVVAIGANGIKDRLGGLLGNAVQSVAKNCDRLMLMVRKPYTGLGRVLVALDGSSRDRDYLSLLSRFIPADGPELHVLYCAPRVVAPTTSALSAHGPYSTLPPTPAEVEMAAEQLQAEEDRGREVLQRATHTLRMTGHRVQPFFYWGGGATNLCSHAQAQHCDLIVTRRLAQTSVWSWLWGDDMNYVVQHAPCSVLQLPGEDKNHLAWGHTLGSRQSSGSP